MKIKDISNQNFCRWTVLSLSDRRDSRGGAYWWCQCSCKQKTIREVSGTSLRQGTSKSCGCLQREVAKKNMLNNKYQEGRKKILEHNSLVGKRFGKLLVLETTDYRDKCRRVIWKCQCDCGNIHYTSTSNLTTGDCISCGCLNQSKGEFFIEQFLKNHQINYKKEYTFDNLRSDKNALLRFDFAIFDNNNELKQLIEFDGEQHFVHQKENSFFNKEYLIKLQYNDKIKNEYCQQNKIPLIRIPYTEIDNLTNILEENIFTGI